ncbi:MAG: ATP-binding protein [Phyllobacteriaceae bacterium]|jgi:two-component system C4-dicarboxylate transport sensor histidine kinase DctB|nr:ATP-binding protein [Phyllobacteriaceae bacterium]
MQKKLWSALLVAATLIAGGFAYQLVSSQTQTDLATQLSNEALLARQSLINTIEQYRILPSVIGNDPRLISVLDDRTKTAAANRYLKTVRGQSGTAELFLLDATGNTIAASNHDEEPTFIGENYQFRPYFLDALAHGTGQFYAIGATTGIPGYFISTRVISPAGTVGVVVVKVDLREVALGWKAANSLVAVTDKDGIVFLTSIDEWLYRPVVSLTDEKAGRIVASRKFGNANVVQATPIFADNATEFSLDGGTFVADQNLVTRVDFPYAGWSVIQRTSLGVVQTTALAAAISVGLATLLLGAAMIIFSQRRSLIRLKLAQTEELERKVEERTTALAQEIEERKGIETALRETQDGLVQAAKMAALGQMSAAIVHEVSQPLAALENTLASAGIYAERGEPDKTTEKVKGARRTIERIQRMVRHLKSFARRENPPRLQPISVNAAVREAVALAEPHRKEVGARIESAVPDNLMVMAGDVRLAQVILNLTINALDAARGSDQPIVVISADSDDDGRTATIEVRDNGPGINIANVKQLAEPFYTTKETGEGLGLGLSISNMITEEFGGRLSLQNDHRGGCIASVTLRRAGETATGDDGQRSGRQSDTTEAIEAMT